MENSGVIVALEISVDLFLFFLYTTLKVGHGDKQDFMLHTGCWSLYTIIMTPCVFRMTAGGLAPTRC